MNRPLYLIGAKWLQLLVITLTFLLNKQQQASAQQKTISIGDKICIAGYVMDTFCINRGTLLDNNAVVTLSAEGPVQHTVHCLIDVDRCRNSHYEMLVELENGDFGRGWRIADKKMVVDHARSIGSCGTCESGNTDPKKQRTGFRATLNATVTTLGGGDIPAIIDVTQVQDFEEFHNICGNTTTFAIPNVIMGAGSAAAKFQKLVLVHGSLMLVGWGLLLPAGAIIARFGKHRPNGWWFKIHKVVQPLGLGIVIIAWTIALVNFEALQSAGDGTLSFPHALCGMITMTIGILQPVNAFLRPHLPEHDGEKKTNLRVAWEIFHKTSGWAALLLAVVTIGIGTALVNPEDQIRFRLVYGLLVGGLLLSLVTFLLVEKRSDKRN